MSKHSNLKKVLSSVLALMMVLGSLVVIPMMFPYYLAAMYQNLLHLNVTVQSGLTPVAVLLAVLSGAVALLSRRLEADLDMNPFE